MSIRERSEGRAKVNEAFARANEAYGQACAYLDGIDGKNGNTSTLILGENDTSAHPRFVETVSNDDSLGVPTEFADPYREDGSYDTDADVYNIIDKTPKTKSEAETKTFRQRTLGKAAVVLMAGLAALGIGGVKSIQNSEAITSPTSVSASNEAGPAKAVQTNHESDSINPNKEAIEQAVQDKLSEIGLKPGQYTEVTDHDAELPGAIEANYYSMNGGSDAWAKYPRTVNGAKQMSEDLLNARNGFSSERAFVGMAAMEKAGVPVDVIAKLGAGNYDGIQFNTYTLNGKKGVYHEMTYNTGEGLGVEDTRTVDPLDQDAITIISWMGDDGIVHSAAFRMDCGGTNIQSFKYIIVSGPYKPPVKPGQPDKETPTTTPPTTTPPTTTPPTTTPPTTTPPTTTPPTTTIPDKCAEGMGAQNGKPCGTPDSGPEQQPVQENPNGVNTDPTPGYTRPDSTQNTIPADQVPTTSRPPATLPPEVTTPATGTVPAPR